MNSHQQNLGSRKSLSIKVKHAIRVNPRSNKLVKFRHIELKYLYSGFASSIIAALFAIVYSKDLGAQNRGVVTTILLSNLFYASILSGGVNIAYKSHRGDITAKRYLLAFIRFSFILVFSISILVTLSLVLYSSFKNSVPVSLLILSVLYTISCAFITQLNQVLISFAKISTKLKLDLVVVSLQPIIFFSLQHYSDYSTASLVLMSFSLSYLIVSILTIARLWPLIKNSFFMDNKRLSGSLPNLIRNTHSIRSFSILTAFADRIDRIIVLILFSPTQFGVYTFAIGFIGFFRFIPDGLSTLIMSQNSKLATFLESQLTRIRLLIAFLVFTLAAITLASAIPRLMGEEWRISPVTLAFCFYVEFLRGVYIVKITPYFSLDSNKFPAWSIVLIIAVTTVSVLILKDFMGTTSVPISLFLGYLFGLFLIRILRKR